jgi:hypothetical protein
MWLLAVAVVVLNGHASAGVARLADVTKTGTISEGEGCRVAAQRRRAHPDGRARHQCAVRLTDKGIYMGLGLAPGYTVFEDASVSLNVSAPLTFGFSVKDYYRVNGKDQTFGYFSGGPLFTVGLKFIPTTFGTWLLKAGVQFLVLNSNLEAVNTGESFVPIGSVGVAMTY